MGKPKNIIFDQFAKSGYRIEDLIAAFPNSSVLEIQQRLVDTDLSLLRTVERFGYLGMQPGKSRYMNIDKFGNRYVSSHRGLTSWEFSVDQPKCTFIHVYGGSTTLGAHVGDDETLPYFLLKNLHELGYENVVVVNCGGNNHTSLHCAQHLLDDCLSGRVPDYAVFLNGWNDATHADGGGDGIVDFLNACLVASQDNNRESASVLEIRNSIQSVNRDSYRNRTLESKDYDQFFKFFKLRYKSAIGLAAEIEQIFGTKSQFFFEPSAFVDCRKDQDLMPNIRTLNSASPMIQYVFEEVFRLGVAKIVGRKRYRQKRVKSLISCGQELQKFPLFIDETHFTPQFNNYLSKKIADRLRLKSSLTRAKHGKLSDQSEKSKDDNSNYPLW